jgi:hypothetical protein
MASPPLSDVRLYRMDFPDHACHWGLKAIRLLQEKHIPFEDPLLRSQAEVDDFKVEHRVGTTPSCSLELSGSVAPLHNVLESEKGLCAAMCTCCCRHCR